MNMFSNLPEIAKVSITLAVNIVLINIVVFGFKKVFKDDDLSKLEVLKEEDRKIVARDIVDSKRTVQLKTISLVIITVIISIILVAVIELANKV